MNLREYAEGAEKKVVTETFGEGKRAFEVELRLCSSSDLDAIRKKCMKRELQKGPNGQKEWREVADLPRLRQYLMDHCILGWKGLTYAKAMDLCNLTTPNGQKAGFADQDVKFEPVSVEMMLEEALGFEDAVWERIRSLATELDKQEAEEKKVSASTPEGSTVS